MEDDWGERVVGSDKRGSRNRRECTEHRVEVGWRVDEQQEMAGRREVKPDGAWVYGV